MAEIRIKVFPSSPGHLPNPCAGRAPRLEMTAASQTRTLQSVPPDASSVPWGEMAIAAAADV
eukprot:scaffold76160_cov30-Tisochrysis_lutea.AAC.7